MNEKDVPGSIKDEMKSRQWSPIVDLRINGLKSIQRSKKNRKDSGTASGSNGVFLAA